MSSSDAFVMFIVSENKFLVNSKRNNAINILIALGLRSLISIKATKCAIKIKITYAKRKIINKPKINKS